MKIDVGRYLIEILGSCWFLIARYGHRHLHAKTKLGVRTTMSQR